MEQSQPVRTKRVERVMKRLFGIPAEKGFIWGLADNWTGTNQQVLAWLIFILIFLLSGFSPIRAITFVFCMLSHEMGHALLFELRGIAYRILFLPPFGAAVVPINASENERSDQLPTYDLAWFIQLGPLMNVALMAIGVILQQPPWSHHPWLQVVGQELVFVNGVLALLNLPAIGILDGGLVYKLVFYSVPRAWKRAISLFVLDLSLILIFIALLPHMGSAMELVGGILIEALTMIFFIAMVTGIWRLQHSPVIRGVKSEPMSGRQVLIQVLLHGFMFLAVFAML